jgi:hypothetical protein
MAAVLEERPVHAALEKAREQAAKEGLAYAGGVAPRDAWALVSAGNAVLVDVRTAEERKFVGYVPDSVHVAWATGTSLTRNPRFVRELEAKTGRCRRAAAVPQRQPVGARGGRGSQGRFRTRVQRARRLRGCARRRAAPRRPERLAFHGLPVQD